jgi:hypothetical protein
MRMASLQFKHITKRKEKKNLVLNSRGATPKGKKMTESWIELRLEASDYDFWIELLTRVQ